MPSTFEDSVDFKTGEHRTRVLLLAYACSPYRGGEAGVGWHRVLETAKKFDTWVLCKQQQYEPDIRRFLNEQGEFPGLHFCFIRSWYRKTSPHHTKSATHLSLSCLLIIFFEYINLLISSCF